ncbi:hypothetical protein BJ684DRAFT_15457 [Piptocephalis cylindrospora]|uniref:DUF4211 domain-containing protein n=1 Tax=Piptocephalis cylindrospora TaxID=1907219 RepID=A0A4P9Y5C5_9FUNG|nr:hypothetical protein BJ684DRAFT_15457 [Piptocephalis cylindrospora]|eukprot:RKP14206.1 hypothetical protein BJ684DRAFT_15457 [Piptocephalis cylindrospora]
MGTGRRRSLRWQNGSRTKPGPVAPPKKSLKFPRPKVLVADLVVDCVLVDNTAFKPRQNLSLRPRRHLTCLESEEEEEEEEEEEVDETDDELYTSKLRTRKKKPSYRLKSAKSLRFTHLDRQREENDLYQLSESTSEADEVDSEEEAKEERKKRLELWKLHRTRRRAAWSDDDVIPTGKNDETGSDHEYQRVVLRPSLLETSSKARKTKKHPGRSILAQIQSANSETEEEFIRDKRKDTADPVEVEDSEISEDEMSYMNKKGILKQRIRGRNSITFSDRRKKAQRHAMLRGMGKDISSTDSSSEEDDASQSNSDDPSDALVDEDHFIVEEDEEDLASQKSLLEAQGMIPSQFRLTNSLPMESCLRIIIEAYVIELLHPGFLQKIDKENIVTYCSAMESLDRRLDGVRDSSIASMGWTSEFKNSLDASPFLDVEYDVHNADIVCEACHSTKYHITMSLTVCIDPVHPRYFHASTWVLRIHITGKGSGKVYTYHTGKTWLYGEGATSHSALLILLLVAVQRSRLAMRVYMHSHPVLALTMHAKRPKFTYGGRRHKARSGQTPTRPQSVEDISFLSDEEEQQEAHILDTSRKRVKSTLTYSPTIPLDLRHGKVGTSSVGLKEQKEIKIDLKHLPLDTAPKERSTPIRAIRRSVGMTYGQSRSIQQVDFSNHASWSFEDKDEEELMEGKEQRKPGVLSHQIIRKPAPASSPFQSLHDLKELGAIRRFQGQAHDKGISWAAALFLCVTLKNPLSSSMVLEDSYLEAFLISTFNVPSSSNGSSTDQEYQEMEAELRDLADKCGLFPQGMILSIDLLGLHAWAQISREVSRVEGSAFKIPWLYTTRSQEVLMSLIRAYLGAYRNRERHGWKVEDDHDQVAREAKDIYAPTIWLMDILEGQCHTHPSDLARCLLRHPKTLMEMVRGMEISSVVPLVSATSTASIHLNLPYCMEPPGFLGYHLAFVSALLRTFLVLSEAHSLLLLGLTRVGGLNMGIDLLDTSIQAHRKAADKDIWGDVALLASALLSQMFLRALEDEAEEKSDERIRGEPGRSIFLGNAPTHNPTLEMGQWRQIISFAHYCSLSSLDGSPMGCTEMMAHLAIVLGAHWVHQPLRKEEVRQSLSSSSIRHISHGLVGFLEKQAPFLYDPSTPPYLS